MKKIAIVFGREYTSKTSEKSSQEFEESVNSKLEELEKNKYHIITIRFTQTNSGRTAYIYYNTEKINFPDFTDFNFSESSPFFNFKKN